MTAIIKEGGSYIGEYTTSNTFKIKRHIYYRNSFLPQIKGEIYGDINGSSIIVNIKLDSSTSIFMAVWLILVSIFCVLIVSKMISDGFEFMFLIPFAMLAFGIILTWSAFKIESVKSKKDIAKIFEADMQE